MKDNTFSAVIRNIAICDKEIKVEILNHPKNNAEIFSF